MIGSQIISGRTLGSYASYRTIALFKMINYIFVINILPLLLNNWCNLMNISWISVVILDFFISNSYSMILKYGFWYSHFYGWEKLRFKGIKLIALHHRELVLVQMKFDPISFWFQNAFSLYSTIICSYFLTVWVSKKGLRRREINDKNLMGLILLSYFWFLFNMS